MVPPFVPFKFFPLIGPSYAQHLLSLYFCPSSDESATPPARLVQLPLSALPTSRTPLPCLIHLLLAVTPWSVTVLFLNFVESLPLSSVTSTVVGVFRLDISVNVKLYSKCPIQKNIPGLVLGFLRKFPILSADIQPFCPRIFNLFVRRIQEICLMDIYMQNK